MRVNHYLPCQYEFAIEAKNYMHQIVNYGGMSVLYYQFEAPSHTVKMYGVPDGCADIIFNCTENKQSGSIYGSVLSHSPVNFIKSNLYFGVRLPPTISRRMNWISYGDLINNHIDICSLNVAHSFLFDLLPVQNSFTSKCKLVELWLKDIGLFNSKEFDIIDHAINFIFQSQGKIRIDDLSDKLGYSERYIRKQFAVKMGLSPKQFSCITRFQSIVSHWLNTQPLKNNPDKHAYMQDYNYFDESHMARETLRFSELTPSQLASKLSTLNTNYASAHNAWQRE